MNDQQNNGFTLVEVVVSLLILEISVVGVLGSLVLTAGVSRRAEELERSVVAFQSVVDSLRGVDPAGITDDSIVFPGGFARWSVSAEGWLTVSAGARDGSLVRAVMRLPLR